MRKEYDFSKGVRGMHFGKVRIIGPVEPAPSEASKKLRRSLEADLRKFGVLEKLDSEQKRQLRASWDRKIDKALNK